LRCPFTRLFGPAPNVYFYLDFVQGWKINTESGSLENASPSLRYYKSLRTSPSRCWCSCVKQNQRGLACQEDRGRAARQYMRTFVVHIAFPFMLSGYLFPLFSVMLSFAAPHLILIKIECSKFQVTSPSTSISLYGYPRY